jgi:isoleucyl-tRNA synthetase
VESVLNDPLNLRNASVVIWTTTPWTIPQNRAVCFNDDISYGLYRVVKTPDECWAAAGDLYLVAKDLAEEVFAKARLDRDDWEPVRDVSAYELAGLTLAHPLRGTVPLTEPEENRWDYPVPMLPGDHVTDEAGTGFVHTAPSHGADDYIIGVKHGLKMTHNVMEDSSFRADLPFFGGALIFDHKGKEKDANTRVINKLVEVGGLLARGRIKHSYPHSWRSKAPVIFRNTPQWFTAIDKPLDDGMDANGKTIRERALYSIDNLVTWTPQTGRNRLHAMIEARPDWVMSRQRAWGVPLTCFIKDAGNGEVDILRDPAVNARIAAAFRESGADVWYEDGAKERFLGGLHDAEDWTKVDDILDVWFDSGSTHAFVLRDRPDGTPDGIADLYLEGTDQHRGWFHSSLLQACGTKGRAPYKGVLTHGFTLDEKGMKMSKSLGNTIVPAEVTKQYGADILRLWVAQVDFTNDQRIGPEILKGVADSYRRLRNTMRFMLGNLSGFDDAHRVATADMPELERWVLHRMAELDRVVRDGYGRYDFQGVFQALFQFCTVDLSAVYFDIRKDALYCDGDDSQTRRAAQTVLDLLFHRLTTWLAPVLVFTMEDVWLTRFPGDDSSVHLQDIPETPAAWLDADLAAKWDGIRRVRRVVTAALEVQRRDKVIGASLEAAPVVQVRDKDLLAAVKSVPCGDFCITSAVALSGEPVPQEAFRLPEVEGIGVVFEAAEGEKCGRCWKIQPDVGTHGHAGVFGRCDSAL